MTRSPLIAMENSTHCTRVSTELSANPDEPWRHPALSLHLAGCPSCRKFRRQVLEQRAEIVRHLDAARPPPALRGRIQQAMRLARGEGER